MQCVLASDGRPNVAQTQEECDQSEVASNAADQEREHYASRRRSTLHRALRSGARHMHHRAQVGLLSLLMHKHH